MTDKLITEQIPKGFRYTKFGFSFDEKAIDMMLKGIVATTGTPLSYDDRQDLFPIISK